MVVWLLYWWTNIIVQELFHPGYLCWFTLNDMDISASLWEEPVTKYSQGTGIKPCVRLEMHIFWMDISNVQCKRYNPNHIYINATNNPIISWTRHTNAMNGLHLVYKVCQLYSKEMYYILLPTSTALLMSSVLTSLSPSTWTPMLLMISKIDLTLDTRWHEDSPDPLLAMEIKNLPTFSPSHVSYILHLRWIPSRS